MENFIINPTFRFDTQKELIFLIDILETKNIAYKYESDSENIYFCVVYNRYTIKQADDILANIHNLYKKYKEYLEAEMLKFRWEEEIKNHFNNPYGTTSLATKCQYYINSNNASEKNFIEFINQKKYIIDNII
jgi:hypothetical protein